MTLPDNRIRFSSTRTDFANDVGLTGQDHDNYPPPAGQARYDHLRMALIGLLSQQSSFEEPSQRRDGTPWFDLNTFTLKIWINGAWRLYSEAIPLTEDSTGSVVTLAQWYASVSTALIGLAPEIVFRGQSSADGVDTITIPESLRQYTSAESRVFLYVNGSLVDPYHVTLIGNPPTAIHLSVVTLSNGDVFIVNIRRIAAATFFGTTVVVP